MREPDEPEEESDKSVADEDVCEDGDNPRERGDDDGVEYADPHDEIADRLHGW